MSTPPFSPDTTRKAAIKQFTTNPLSTVVARIALSMAAVGFTVGAAAQGVLVNDKVSIAKQVAEYGEQATRWTKTLAQYKQMIATVMNLDFKSLLPTAQLQKITDTAKLIQQACPGSGSLVTDLISSIGPMDFNSASIKQNQDRICQNIVQLRITSYNETVDMLGRLQQYNGLFQQIDQLRNMASGSESSVGDMQANTNEAVRNTNKLQNEMSNWQARMTIYETAIKTLESQQSVLASVALKGKASLTGKAIQAATFAGAFSSH
ncbi:hypothetical protein [Variovorax sp. ZT4R33]|uniref:hypothetical protein n=1 Tax=Variovorax sp. ZT4R33 TaxID=3443743 RepID=UPI003F45565D